MNGTSHVMGVYIVCYGSRFWIPTFRSRPTKTISNVRKGQEHASGLSVCLYDLSVKGLRLVVQPL